MEFKWKKKRKLQTEPSKHFSNNDHNNDGINDSWLTPSKLSKLVMLEDNESASRRHQQEGVILAENERYWEALKYWNEALELTPNSATLHEMKSQVLLELGEVFPAIESGEKAVTLDPTWSLARQTLGRAQLGIGELDMALSNFQKGLHLDPTNNEIRVEDTSHTLYLKQQRNSLSQSIVSISKEEENIAN